MLRPRDLSPPTAEPNPKPDPDSDPDSDPDADGDREALWTVYPHAKFQSRPKREAAVAIEICVNRYLRI
jgi:hypothetical protein